MDITANNTNDKKQNRLSRQIYASRIFGYLLVFNITGITFYYQNQDILPWVFISIFCFAWPHIAYYSANKSQNPNNTEFKNFAIDSFFGGMTLPLMSFSIIPSITICGIYNLSYFSVGGFRLFLKRSLFFILGIFILVPFTHRYTQFDPSPLIIFSCIVSISLYSMMVALKTHSLAIINNKDKSSIQLQKIELEKAYEEIKRQHYILENLANLDCLTGIPNRRRFNEYIKNQWKNAQRAGIPISAIMIDIDDFKAYNDLYGHNNGDECLKKITQILSETIKRPNDILARYGGDEVICLLPTTDWEGALNLAEKMRKNVMSLSIPHKNSSANDCVTISLGVSSMLPTKELHYSILLEDADKALYEAKNNGRNCVKSLACYMDMAGDDPENLDMTSLKN